MRPASVTAPSTPRAGASTGSDFRGLVQWAVEQRDRMLTYGWSHIDAAYARNCMRPLHEWIEHHPYVSVAAMLACWAKHEHQIRIVMPGNAAGKKKLKQIEQLIVRAKR